MFESIPVRVHSDYVDVDTSEWLAAIGDVDDHLTESLRDWLTYRDGDVNGYYSGRTNPHTEHIVRWAGVRFRADKRTRDESNAWTHMCTGLYGEGEPWRMFTFNEGDHLLSVEIGAVWFYAPDGTLLFVEVANCAGLYCEPTVYRVTVSDEALTEYSRASGACRNGHYWETDDGGVRMHGDSGIGTVGDRIRPIPSGHYLACPECGKGVSLFVNLW